jgi:hypothetical protein
MLQLSLEIITVAANRKRTGCGQSDRNQFSVDTLGWKRLGGAQCRDGEQQNMTGSTRSQSPLPAKSVKPSTGFVAYSLQQRRGRPDMRLAACGREAFLALAFAVALALGIATFVMTGAATHAFLEQR